MSLVAYGGGSSDEDSGDEVETTRPSADIATSSRLTSLPSTSSTALAPKKFSKFEDSDEDDTSTENELSSGTAIFNSLPIPTGLPEHKLEAEDVFEEGPVPPKKTYDGQVEEKPPEKASLLTGFAGLKAQRLGGRIQIAAPSLKDFENDESEQKSRITQPAKKGSGLFSILPPPKYESSFAAKFIKSEQDGTSKANLASSTGDINAHKETKPVKTNSLIPDAVRQSMLGKRPTASKLDEIKAKYLKQEANVKIVSRGSAKSAQHSDSEEEEEAMDFFSFAAASEKIPDDPSLRLPDYVPPEPIDESPSVSQMEEPQYAEQAEQMAIDPTQFIRQGKKKKEQINFIDVNAADLRPDAKEWMLHINEEAPPPAKPKNAPGGMVKRKHQITYLAFEAKAREQTLKNQWAQNKHNKRVTQSKYGF